MNRELAEHLQQLVRVWGWYQTIPRLEGDSGLWVWVSNDATIDGCGLTAEDARRSAVAYVLEAWLDEPAEHGDPVEMVRGALDAGAVARVSAESLHAQPAALAILPGLDRHSVIAVASVIADVTRAA